MFFILLMIIVLKVRLYRTNYQSRCAGAPFVFLDLPEKAWHHLTVYSCCSEVPKVMHKARLRALKGTRRQRQGSSSKEQKEQYPSIQELICPQSKVVFFTRSRQRKIVLVARPGCPQNNWTSVSRCRCEAAKIGTHLSFLQNHAHLCYDVI